MDHHTGDDDGERPALTGQSECEQVLVADVVSSRAGSIECTISPRDAPDDERTTAWITAGKGSFVGLDEMR